MKMKRFAAMLTFAVAVSLGLSDLAKADYNYSTAIVITTLNGGAVSPSPSNQITFGGTTVTFLGVSRTGFVVPGSNTIDIGDIQVTSITPASGGDSFTVGYTDTFTLTNVGPPGTPAVGSFPLNGTLTLTGINTGSGVITNAFSPPTSASGPLGGLTFTGSTVNFASPTVNGTNGSIGGLISAVNPAVPEPVSFLMLGLGLGGVGLVGFRNRHARV